MQHNMLSESERRDHQHRVARDDLQDQLARHQVLLGELEQQVVTKTDVIGQMQSRLTQSDHRARRLEAGLQGTSASDIIGTIPFAFHSSVPLSRPPCDVPLNVVPMLIGCRLGLAIRSSHGRFTSSGLRHQADVVAMQTGAWTETTATAAAAVVNPASLAQPVAAAASATVGAWPDMSFSPSVGLAPSSPALQRGRLYQTQPELQPQPDPQHHYRYASASQLTAHAPHSSRASAEEATIEAHAVDSLSHSLQKLLTSMDGAITGAPPLPHS